MGEYYDYRGNEIADPYHPDDDGMVTVWELEPSGSCSYQSVLIRGWQEMLEHLEDVLDRELSDLKVDESTNSSETLEARFSLFRMTAYQWREFCRLGDEYPGEPIDVTEIPLVDPSPAE